jgi:Na+/proline symporter
MKATIWNDFIQMVVVVIGLLILLIVGSIAVDGNIWSIAYEGHRIEFDK